MRDGIGGGFRLARLKIARVDCLNVRKCVCTRGILFGKIHFRKVFAPLRFGIFCLRVERREGKARCAFTLRRKR